jgi:hypothetical protein
MRQFEPFRLPNRLSALLSPFEAMTNHELFHFYVERFVLKQEVIQRIPIYRPYVERLRSQVRRTDRWLEEALAQAVVLESRLVSRKAGYNRKAIKTMLVPEFRKFPEGYRQFECKPWSGPAQAHRFFAAQVVTAEERPSFTSTDLAAPKKLYRGSGAI